MSEYTININIYLPNDATPKNGTNTINQNLKVHPLGEPVRGVTVEVDDSTMDDELDGPKSGDVISVAINFSSDQGDNILPVQIKFDGNPPSRNPITIPASGKCVKTPVGSTFTYTCSYANNGRGPKEDVGTANANISWKGNGKNQNTDSSVSIS